MKLTLVRHAQPLVASGVCYGALDMPADTQATRQAASNLAPSLSTGLQVITSPLQRCQQLAQSLQELRPDLRYQTDARLTEMNFGCFEGQRWDSIAPESMDEWTADFWQHRFGGVESVAALMARVASVWDEATASGQPQVWITHAGVIRAATLLAQGVRRIERAQDWPLAGPAFGQWLELPAHHRPAADD